MSDAPIPRARPWCWDLLFVCALLAVGGMLYARALDVPWYFDDYQVLFGNPDLRSVSRALEGVLRPRGVAILSFAVGDALLGKDAAEAHAVNVGIHLATSITLYAVLRTLAPGSRLAAFGGALLFAVHPLQTQAVLYAVQRMASLATFWLVLSMLLFLRARRLVAAGSPWRPRHLALYAGALLAGAAAFLTKQNTVVFPALFLLADLLFGPPAVRPRDRALYHAPFFALASLLALRELLPSMASAAGAGGALVRSFDWFVVGYTGPGEPILEATPARYVLTQLSVVWQYLRLVAVPVGQAFDHGYPLVREYVSGRTIAAALGLAALAALAVRARTRAPFLALGVAAFLLGLAVESLFPLDVMVEHRLYLAMPGVSLAFVEGLRRIGSRAAAAATIAVVATPLAALTLQRVDLWTRPADLLEHDLRVRPANPRLWALLGETRQRAGDLGGAAAAFSKALELHPRYPQALVNLAGVRATEGRPQDAERLYREAIALVPGFPAARRALALVLMRQQRSAEALEEFGIAARMNPNDLLSLYFEATLAHELGDDARARRAADRIDRLDPEAAADVRAMLGL